MTKVEEAVDPAAWKPRGPIDDPAARDPDDVGSLAEEMLNTGVDAFNGAEDFDKAARTPGMRIELEDGRSFEGQAAADHAVMLRQSGRDSLLLSLALSAREILDALHQLLDVTREQDDDKYFAGEAPEAMICTIPTGHAGHPWRDDQQRPWYCPGRPAVTGQHVAQGPTQRLSPPQR